MLSGYACCSLFLAGSDWAFFAGMMAVLLAAALVFFAFPHQQQEEALHRGYHAQDSQRAGMTSSSS